MNDIVLSGISKSFDGKMVLHDVTAEIAAGETVCIRGRSGIGKTTLLRIIAGLIEPDSGTVSGIPGKIAFVFQEDRLSEEFSAERRHEKTCSSGKGSMCRSGTSDP